MSNIKEHDLAFPLIDQNNPSTAATGLTKREWYAGLAMQGMLSSLPPLTAEQEYKFDRLAKRSISAADALINELNKIQP